jgi:hypothetical protein
MRILKREMFRLRHERILNSMTTMEHFQSYVLRVQPEEFLQYEKKSPQKRLDFQSVMRELGLKLGGSYVLDIGPGYGDSLDICHQEGAEGIEFIEIDPFFYTYNRLKGFALGYRLDHLTGLGRLSPRRFDLIWIKGSVSADLFITRSRWGTGKSLLSTSWTELAKSVSSPRWITCPPLLQWLTRLEGLASPQGKIILCPHWFSDDGQRHDDIFHNPFTDTLLGKGYIILTRIAHHNHEPEYPITFYRNMAQAAWPPDILATPTAGPGHPEKLRGTG